MIRVRTNILLLLFLVVAVSSTRSKIRHIIVLMEENRSFDHIFGMLKGVNGLKGNESNPVSTIVPSKSIPVNTTARYVARCDPDHSVPGTSEKLFGRINTLQNATHGVPCMCGFVEDERDKASTDYCDVMNVFTPDRLPVLTTLAEEFVVCDRFFASVPGPTWPNRLFMLSATSAGLTETSTWYHSVPGNLFPQPTIFDQVEEAGGSWRLYYNDTPWEVLLESVAHHPEHVRILTEFFEDAKSGHLPDFAFIDPRAGVNVSTGQCSNDMHPDHDVRSAETLVKAVYEALRASPSWHETLFIVTFDEHGGFYDHVPPPSNISAPQDGEESYPDEFAFDRLGVRIPTILISPWLPKGLVLSGPPKEQMPQNNSEYDLTSIMATARKLLPILKSAPPLTGRDAWAATFEHLFDLRQHPRTDCPRHLPNVSASHSAEYEAALPINSLQESILGLHGGLVGRNHRDDGIDVQGKASEWAQQRYEEHKHRTQKWKSTKFDKALSAVLRPGGSVDPTKHKSILARSWHSDGRNISTGSALKPSTIHADLVDEMTNGTTHFCLTTEHVARQALIGVARCYPSYRISKNRDKHQQWLIMDDATLRPLLDSTLCASTFILDSVADSSLRLLPCDGKIHQRFNFGGEQKNWLGTAGAIENGVHLLVVVPTPSNPVV